MANMLREGMHPLDEAEAINNVLEDGDNADYDTLAAQTGVKQESGLCNV